MPTQDQLIASHLQKALESGELAGAEGFGKPMTEDEAWAATPEEFRLPFKILRNAGFAPPEIAWFRRRAELAEAIAAAGPGAGSEPLRRELAELEQRIALRLEAMRTRGAL